MPLRQALAGAQDTAELSPSVVHSERHSSADLPAAFREPQHGQTLNKLRRRWKRGERLHGRRPRSSNTTGTFP
ncbi:hypothetical protein EUGRSUZ_C03643 [Eucalyptus grandis]|uniref:Uncharacterized protein n=2 Tax=Eucalyptus grandis TaxID=71139 RepID=A0ACC3LIZ7_EUCGR|nr:hypothetical protein EUGRSUZ_C03643 [Eucalyptus grandis]